MSYEDILPPSDSLKKYHSAGLDRDKSFFFIVGSPRSGTLWFSHFMTTAQTYCYHELGITCHSSRYRDVRSGFPRLRGSSSEASHMLRLLYLYPSFCRRLIHRLYEREERVAVGDSDGELPTLYLALARIFPQARFVGTIRNGPDWALSMMRANRSYTWEVACRGWKNSVTNALRLAKALGDRAQIVFMDRLWGGVDDPCKVWDHLVDGHVPADATRLTKLCKTPINASGKRLPGATIAERWHSLAPDRQAIFLDIAGPRIADVPGAKGWPNLEF